MQAVNPYLNFDGNAAQAFQFYKSVFGGDFAVVVRFKDMGAPPGTPAHELERIAHISLPLDNGSMLMASDILPSLGHTLHAGNNFYISLSPTSGEEADRLFAGLSSGGTVEMAPQRTAWAEKFSTFKDRFGIQWMISYAGEVQFTGAQKG